MAGRAICFECCPIWPRPLAPPICPRPQPVSEGAGGAPEGREISVNNCLVHVQGGGGQDHVRMLAPAH